MNIDYPFSYKYISKCLCRYRITFCIFYNWNFLSWKYMCVPWNRHSWKACWLWQTQVGLCFYSMNWKVVISLKTSQHRPCVFHDLFFFPVGSPIWIRFDEYSFSGDNFKFSESPVLIHLPPAKCYTYRRDKG